VRCRYLDRHPLFRSTNQVAGGLAGIRQFYCREMAKRLTVVRAAGMIAKLLGAPLFPDAQDQAGQHGVVPFAGR